MTAAGQSGAQLPGHGQQCEGLSHYSNSSDCDPIHSGFGGGDLDTARDRAALVFALAVMALPFGFVLLCIAIIKVCS